ncbi:MAG: hypothetical protein V2J02_15930 [Pseudomonadales bacterium]|nr:hypothetical protein [Pseudomonadales bacterium]
MLLFLFFTVDNVRRGGIWVEVGAFYALGAALAASAFLAWATPAYLWFARLCLAYCCAMMCLGFLVAPGAFTFAWVVFAPAAAIVLFGRTEGLVWAGLVWLFWAALLLRPETVGIDPTARDWPGPDRAVAVLVVLLLVTGLTAGYETIRLRTRSALEDEAAARARAEHERVLLARVAGGIAHEVNNGLLVLQGNLDLLEEDRDEAGRPGNPGIEAMRSAIRDLHGLGNRLLAATGQQRLQPVAVELPELLQAAIDRSSGGGASPPVLEVEAGLPAVRVDPVRFGAVLDALLANAREADGGPWCSGPVARSSTRQRPDRSSCSRAPASASPSSTAAAASHRMRSSARSSPSSRPPAGLRAGASA